MLIGCATLFGQELDLLVVARLSNHDLTYHAIVVKAGLSATFSLSPINIALIDSSEWIILTNMARPWQPIEGGFTHNETIGELFVNFVLVSARVHREGRIAWYVASHHSVARLHS